MTEKYNSCTSKTFIHLILFSGKHHYTAERVASSQSSHANGECNQPVFSISGCWLGRWQVECANNWFAKKDINCPEEA